MATMPEALAHSLAMWNERDPDRVREHIDRGVAEDVSFVDPRGEHLGRDALHEAVRRFRTAFPEADLSLTSGVDGHHNRYRYTWQIVEGGKTIQDGFDVMTLDSHGLIKRVVAFFGPLPPKND